MAQDSLSQLIGQSPCLVEIKEEIEAVSRSDAKVLVTGESGTGKELIARAIHQGSARAARPFVAMNCAGMPETLLESELFGYVKGSFTGAYRDKPGKLEIADGGTVFLDEIGEMTLRMQGLLLRFLESGELQKVGADRGSRTVNVRIIAATNRNLRDLIAQGQFREDLFYRLNVIHLVAPPLRERKDDIPILADYFLKRFTPSHGNGNGNGNGHGNGNGNGHGNGHGNGAASKGARTLTPETLAALAEYSWPGNVRELQNVIERLVVKGRSDIVGLEELPVEIRELRNKAVRPSKERRRTVADDLYQRLVKDGESFWSTVHPLYMQREITRSNVRDLVRKGLEDARGNYKIVARLFNMGPEDYKKFLNFLRKHECQLPFKEYR
jgi:transcriptional regulator with PAS, ATPase and Fis domain